MVVSKCGIDCGLCPWGPYPREGMSDEDFERFRRRAKSILGYMPVKTACPTCQVPDTQIPKKSLLPNKRCLIRKCVDKTGIDNCAYCSRFPCDTLKATAGAWNRESLEKKRGKPLSEEDYQRFVVPFEGIHRLENIRNKLRPQEIVEPAKTPKTKNKIIPYPTNLSCSKEENQAFESVHKLLTDISKSSLGLSDTDTFAQQNKLETNRAHIFRFLWIIGRHGKFDDTTGSLLVDAKAYIDNRGNEKSLAMWPFVNEIIFPNLLAFGITCERISLEGTKEADLKTGMGYLRQKGWTIQIALSEKHGGTNTLKALQKYTKKLEVKYGKKAVQQFQTADMQPLMEN
ncbi:MAG: hypothetical protein CW716_02655 [Candidatus Bathyarchaeum sp.]|nr:MAG: hypothetical protein CW716_02655 [Candidatus Bathyarchaeum sp.]